MSIREDHTEFLYSADCIDHADLDKWHTLEQMASYVGEEDVK